MSEPPANDDNPILDAIANADEVPPNPPVARHTKPRLLVQDASPDQTVAALRDPLAKGCGLYDRGVPVRLAFDQTERARVAQILTPDVLVLMAHGVCRPYAIKEKKGTLKEVNVRLPRPFAVMYLDWRGEWDLPPLNGIASAPLLDRHRLHLLAENQSPMEGDHGQRGQHHLRSAHRPAQTHRRARAPNP